MKLKNRSLEGIKMAKSLDYNNLMVEGNYQVVSTRCTKGRS